MEGNQGENAKTFGIILPEGMLEAEWGFETQLTMVSNQRMETEKYRIVGTYTGSLGNGLQKNTVLVSRETME